MSSEDFIRQVTDHVIRQLNMLEPPQDAPRIPIGISSRHIHLSQADTRRLFGPGYQLTVLKQLNQPGEFAARETLQIIGPKGSLQGVRIIGPLRRQSQVEISRTDAFTLGLNPPLRDSSQLQDSPGVALVGPAGSLSLKEGVIIAARHIHLQPAEAERWGLKNGDRVSVRVDGERGLTFGNVLVRVQDNYRLEMHIDTDEANAGGIKNGDTGRIVGRIFRTSGPGAGCLPKLLAAISGGSIGFEQGLGELKKLAGDFQLQLVLSKNAGEIYEGHTGLAALSSLPPLQEGETVSLSRLLEDVQGIVIPVLTVNSAAKLAQGISDTLFLNVIIHSLIKGLPVIAARNAADPEDRERKMLTGKNCSPGMLDLAKANLRKLEKMGIRITDAASLAAETRSLILQKTEGAGSRWPGKRTVITEKDISQESIAAKKIFIPEGAILTPLVLDLIRTKGLEVSRMEQDGWHHPGRDVSG